MINVDRIEQAANELLAIAKQIKDEQTAAQMAIDYISRIERKEVVFETPGQCYRDHHEAKKNEYSFRLNYVDKVSELIKLGHE